MVTDAEKVVVMEDMLNHAIHGGRDPSISNEAYEWRVGVITILRDQMLGAEEPQPEPQLSEDNDVKINIGNMEGVYRG